MTEVYKLKTILDSYYSRIRNSLANRDISVYTDCIETVQVFARYFRPEYFCDIGANKGNWTKVLHRFDPDLKEVVFFEPQKKYCDSLEKLEIGKVKKTVYSCGLGSNNSETIIRGGSPSASVLPETRLQNRYFPNSINDEKEKISLRRLDDIYCKDHLHYPDTIKIDVQGYELEVLKGGIKVLSKAKYVIVELSYRKFYIGQPSVWEIIKILEENGYYLVAHGYEWWSSNTRVPHLLQTDGIFRNSGYDEK